MLHLMYLCQMSEEQYIYIALHTITMLLYSS